MGTIVAAKTYLKPAPSSPDVEAAEDVAIPPNPYANKPAARPEPVDPADVALSAAKNYSEWYKELRAGRGPPALPTRRNTIWRQLPAELAEVALIDAETCAATGAVSVSWWYEEVRAGRAPKPAIQQPRLTRWSLAVVRSFWQERVEQAARDPGASERMVAKAKKASIKAREPAAVAKAQATRKARLAARKARFLADLALARKVSTA